MLATDFARDDCLVGTKRRTYATLKREWCCGDCGGRIIGKWISGAWGVACGRCGGLDFIHEAQMDRQRAEAREVLAGLPAELAEALTKGD